MTPTLTINPAFQRLLPPLSAEERQTLRESLQAEGCRDPIVTWNGVILDGHNRYALCQELNIPFDVTWVKLPDEDAAKIWMIDNQKGRRNLTDGWKYELAQVKKALLMERGREKLSEAGTQGNKKRWDLSGLPTLGKPDKSPKHNTQKELATELGWSKGKVAMADKVWQKAEPEIKEKIKAGEVSFHEAYQEIKKENRNLQKKQLVEKVKAPAPVSATGPYDLVLADPPWRYEHQKAGNREIENQYPTATVDEIKTHVPNVEDDAILFLWATAPKLAEAMEVMAAWGFRYVTNAVWDKQKIGMGYWFRGQHELLLVGVKGQPGTVPECERRSSVFAEARGHHSEKPICVYEWIERAFPDKKKLEMYCRKPRKNWASWGNEV